MIRFVNWFPRQDDAKNFKNAPRRANWDLLNTLCIGKLIPENFKESSDQLFDFTSSLIEI